MSDHLPESFSLASILAEQCMCHQEGLWVRWLVKENPETNPIIIKPKTVSHMAEQFSWVPLPSCSLPGHHFPIKSLALSACVSPQTIHFQVLDKSPLLGLGRWSPSCNNTLDASLNASLGTIFSSMREELFEVPKVIYSLDTLGALLSKSLSGGTF